LSGGEKQRVAIARALLKESKLILADEPTGSLDFNNRDEIIKLLRREVDGGKTVVVVSHDPYVGDQSDRIVEI
jgi:putative ABC transport system ATP-binding protein